MKKLVILAAALVMLFSFGFAASAARAVPNGLTVTDLYSFADLPNGDTTGSAIGLWYPGGDYNVTVTDGAITMSDACWGAFPSFSDDQKATLSGKDGFGFYFKASESDAEICYGFNDNGSQNYVLAEGKDILLAAADGTVTTVQTVLNSSYGQGSILIPANFEGYIYIPFANFTKNGTTDQFFPNDGSAVMNTPIFVIGSGVPITYGEIVSYSGTYTPSSEPGGETGDLSMVAYALMAVTGLGSLTVLRKK